MEGIKFIVAGAALMAIVAAVSLSDAKFAGDHSTGEPAKMTEATLESVVEATVDADNGSSGGEDGEAAVSSSIDVTSSVSADIDINMSSSASSSGDAVESAAEPNADANITINGETIACPEGKRMEWEDEDTEVKCRNRNGRINFGVESEGSKSIKIKFTYP